MTDPQQHKSWSEPTWQQPGSPPPPTPTSDATGNTPTAANPTIPPPYGQASPAVPPAYQQYPQPTYQPYQEPAYQQPGYPQAAYPQPAYGQPVYVNPNPTNGMAIASLVCSLAGLLTILSAPVGAILGHVARKQIRERGGQGDGMALAGIIVGWVLTGLSVCGCGLYLGLFALIFSNAAANSS
jgi:hypothetical protein